MLKWHQLCHSVLRHAGLCDAMYRHRHCRLQITLSPTEMAAELVKLTSRQSFMMTKHWHRAAGRSVLNKMALSAQPIMEEYPGHGAECMKSIKDGKNINLVWRGRPRSISSALFCGSGTHFKPLTIEATLSGDWGHLCPRQRHSGLIKTSGVEGREEFKGSLRLSVSPVVNRRTDRQADRLTHGKSLHLSHPRLCLPLGPLPVCSLPSCHMS